MPWGGRWDRSGAWLDEDRRHLQGFVNNRCPPATEWGWAWGLRPGKPSALPTLNNFVFAYGSLVDVDAVSAYLNRPVPTDEWWPCQLRDFRRCWNVAMDNSVDLPNYKYYIDPASGKRQSHYITFLNIYPAPGQAINGIVIRVSRQELLEIDSRERNYSRQDVSRFASLQASDQVWAYRGTSTAEARYQHGLACHRSVVARAYYDQINLSIRKLGPGFARQYQESTDQPNVPIINLRRVDLASENN